jgi:uncharacterized OsmC-like protein
MQGQKNLNGINLDQLFTTIERVRQNPKMAKFRFRARNKWIQGTHNRATTNDFYGAQREDSSRDPMVFNLDEPPVLLGKNQGANPLEYLLLALSGCLTTSLIAHASARGVEIKGVESRYEGELDLRGFLGVSEEVKAGYQNIRVCFKIDAPVSAEQKEELLRIARKYSPVYNTLAQSAPVSVQLDG